MKQSNLGFRHPIERTSCNVLHVAFDKFNPKCRPANYEAALADPVFNRILKARAAQMIKQIRKTKPAFNEAFEVENGCL
jgi:predicted RNase H-like nuclease